MQFYFKMRYNSPTSIYKVEFFQGYTLYLRQKGEGKGGNGEGKDRECMGRGQDGRMGYRDWG